MPAENVNEVIKVAKLAARIILENGGETYRAEETAYRICSSFDFEESDVFAIPTGVFISVSQDGVTTSTVLKRIRKRSVNLEAIDTVNSISRKLIDKKISLAEALDTLTRFYKSRTDKKLIEIMATGLSSGFFALLFRGSLFDFLAATLCGFAVKFVSSSIKTVDMYDFAVSILGGFIIGVGSVLSVTLTGMGNLDKIIAGALMPLLPGVAMVNAIRDTMRGDLVSGVTRAAEALLTSLALAFGVAVVLKVYFQFF